MLSDLGYVLAPGLTYGPGGPIAVGNVLTHPTKPRRALVVMDPEVLRKEFPEIHSTEHRCMELFRKKGNELSVSLWAKFLEIISAKAAGQKGTGSEDEIKAEGFRVSSFIEAPSYQSIKRLMENSTIQGFMKAESIPGFRHPIYLVTGVITAHGVTVRQKIIDERGVKGETSATNPSDASVCAEASYRNAVEDTFEFKPMGDVVWAYQLVKLEMKGLRKRLSTKDYNPSSFLSLKDHDVGLDEEEEVICTGVADWP